MSLQRTRQQIMETIVHAYAEDAGLDEDAAFELAFHLTDWLDDLTALNRLFELDRWDEAARNRLFELLIHAPQHIAAAAFIVTGAPVRDVFNLGATDCPTPDPRPPGAAYR